MNSETVQQEWRWCLVGNIAEEHEYGEEHIILKDNKQFRPGAKVFINLVYGGMAHEDIVVIGLPRHCSKYIEVVVRRKCVCNFRVQKVFKPAVLNKMKASKFEWWDSTDEAHDEIAGYLDWLNKSAENNK